MTKTFTLIHRTYVGLRKPFVFWLLLIDVIFILTTGILGIQALRQPGFETPVLLDISRDESIGEFFNFLKWAVVIGVMFMAYQARGHAMFLSLSIVFLLILADDSLQLHEYIGSVLSRAFPENRELYQTLFELAAFAVLGIICLILILIPWRRTPRDVKTLLAPMALLFLGLVFCGVGLDMIHGFAPRQSLISGILLIGEDGGELVFTSLLAAYAAGNVWDSYSSQERADTGYRTS